MAVNILTQQNLNSASARVQIMPETCQTEIEREKERRERREREERESKLLVFCNCDL